MSHAVVPRSRRARHAGFIATGTLLMSALSALVLVTTCRTSPAASTDCDAACSVGAMPALMPFDEHFYTPPVDGDDSE